MKKQQKTYDGKGVGSLFYEIARDCIKIVGRFKKIAEWGLV